MATLLFVVIFIKSITWSLLTPLWHFPDEQAHFGHVAYLAEGGNLPQGRKPDLTEEIYISEEILGTKRDQQGNNRFTYHPEYRIEYSQTLTGPQEEEIKNLPLRTRKNFAIRESAYYPHLFYQISSLVYKFFYQSNLFIRVFTIRLFWLSAYWLMLWLIYKTAQLIFHKNQLIVTTITILASFHPMLSFVSAGVTSDNLHNLLFTAIIYLSIKIASQATLIDFIWLTLTLGLGISNKQQFFIAFLVIIPSLIIALIKKPKTILKYLALLPLALVIAYLLAPANIGNLLKIFFTGNLPYLHIKDLDSMAMPGYSLFSHIRWTIIHTIREVLPWYWGVFNWLGVVLPQTVNRILIRLLGLAGLGLIIKLIKIIKHRQWTKQNLLLTLTAWAALAYFLVLMIWDWIFMKNNGFSFGIQGRYYFPVISAHMILLTLGVKEFFQLFGKKIAKYSLIILSFWFIVLNLIALYIILNSYYDTNSFKTFILQASQYKPWFAKGGYLVAILFTYLISLVFLSVNLIKSTCKKS